MKDAEYHEVKAREALEIEIRTNRVKVTYRHHFAVAAQRRVTATVHAMRRPRLLSELKEDRKAEMTPVAKHLRDRWGHVPSNAAVKMAKAAIAAHRDGNPTVLLDGDRTAVFFVQNWGLGVFLK